MKRPVVLRIALPAIAALAAVLLASCATVNRLEYLRLDEPELATVLAPPPTPSLDTWYNLGIDTHNPIGTVLRIGSSIVLAAEAEKAAERMREALEQVDVPDVVYEESSARCARALGSPRTGRPRLRSQARSPGTDDSRAERSRRRDTSGESASAIAAATLTTTSPAAL